MKWGVYAMNTKAGCGDVYCCNEDIGCREAKAAEFMQNDANVTSACGKYSILRFQWRIQDFP